MPDKRYAKGCGKKCIKCWLNRLNHGSKLKIKRFPKAYNMENYNIKIDTEENVEYKTLMEEFHDKYIDCCKNKENMIKVEKGYFGKAKDHNDNLFFQTTDAYNDWLYREWRITKKLKSKDLIKTISEACKTADINSKASLYYPDNSNSGIGYYLFTCNYFTSQKLK